ncbi:Hypothetical predicted protein [Octopus vulgaris]|uniref:Uncharacterized protein n=1 Tax=Octopus vulgaris TaxID=6645 RepID=A0AA36F4X4_OCTVU|nr:Hypothetical predicted protein [Octopus vulgaris]
MKLYRDQAFLKLKSRPKSAIVMVRHYKRKSERATLPQDVIQQAIQQVRARVSSLREASRTFGISVSLLLQGFRSKQQRSQS